MTIRTIPEVVDAFLLGFVVTVVLLGMAIGMSKSEPRDRAWLRACADGGRP